jgi:protein CWC15
MRELEKIKKERADQKAKEEAEKAAHEQEEREEHIALGNPLLNPKAFNVKRRWDDDVVFKNQARGTEQKGTKEFVNVSPIISLRCVMTDKPRTYSGPTFTRSSW